MARIAAAAPLNAAHTVAGPEVRDLRDLATSWKSATGSRAVPIRIRIAGMRELRSGALTSDHAQEQGRQGFDAWLSQQPELGRSRARPRARDRGAERG